MPLPASGVHQQSLVPLACSCVTLTSVFVFTWPSFPVCLCILSPYRDTNIGLRVYSTPVLPPLKYLQRRCFQIRAHSGFWVDMNFGEDTIRPPTVHSVPPPIDVCLMCEIHSTHPNILKSSPIPGSILNPKSHLNIINCINPKCHHLSQVSMRLDMNFLYYSEKWPVTRSLEINLLCRGNCKVT